VGERGGENGTTAKAGKSVWGEGEKKWVLKFERMVPFGKRRKETNKPSREKKRIRNIPPGPWAKKKSGGAVIPYRQKWGGPTSNNELKGKKKEQNIPIIKTNAKKPKRKS